MSDQSMHWERNRWKLSQWLWVGILTAMIVVPAAAQNEQPPAARSLESVLRKTSTGVALPNTPVAADLNLEAARVDSWKEGSKHLLLLDESVKVSIGSYLFEADRAVAMIDKVVLPGREAWQIALYFDSVRSIGGGGPVSTNAPRLLVTAVLTGKVNLSAIAPRFQSAATDPLVTEAVARMDRHLLALANNIVDLPDGDPLVSPAELARRNNRRENLAQDRSEKFRENVGQSQSSGLDRLRFRFDKVVRQNGENEDYILVMGNIVLMYPESSTGRLITLEAENAVIFTERGAFDGGVDIGVDDVRGIYLEDDVTVTDGQYTFRGPRIYYDLKMQKALVLDAVFYTWDPKRQVPLYVRASHLRQESANQWSASNATLTTSEFAEPHFAIGLNQLTIRQNQGGDGISAYEFEATGLQFKAGDRPFFYYPSMKGSPTAMPIRSANAGFSSRRGAFFETKWDLFALTNRTAPAGVDASLLVDVYSERGPGLGIEADYDVENAYGELDLYYLYDQGEDEPGGRERIDPEDEHRGKIIWRHRHELPENWQVTIKGSYISDPTFLEEFYRSIATEESELETSLYLKKQDEDWAFSFLMKYDPHDFVPQTDLLQTRGATPIGYTTEKLPELSYFRVATPVWEDRLTWFSENRLSVMRLNLPEDTPRERGFNAAESTALFGIAAGTRFDTPLEMGGLDDNTRTRLDSRQEIQLPLELGAIDLAPYVVGRVTAYDQDFDSYSGESDQMRLWGAAGFRAGTEFSRVYPNVESNLFDLHSMRHLIEPTVHVFFAESTIEQADLPVYDYNVESLAEGTQIRTGVRNTLQTKRGGEGLWRSVDWLRVDTDLIISSDDGMAESPFARFFDYRPESSLTGDHLWNEAAWQVTETLAIIGNADYNMDMDETSRWTIGAVVDHTPRFSSFAQYRELNLFDRSVHPSLRRSAIARYGFEYLLTPKYHVGFAHGYDLERDRNRGFTVSLTRRLPRWMMVMTLDLDEIEDVTAFGIALVPEGIGGRGGPDRNPFLFDRQ